MNKLTSILRNNFEFITSFIVLIILWEFLPKILSIPNYVFPSVSTILESTLSHNNSLLLRHLYTTFIESLIGFILGSSIAFGIGVLMENSRTFAKISLPYVIASNAIPIVALAPIVILWFGSGISSKIVLAAFLCFFPLCINTYKGLNQYKMVYKTVFDVYGASKFDFFLKFKLPNAVPYITTGLKLNAVYAVIGAIVAEFIGSDRGLGFGMLQASYSLNIPRLWGYIILSCMLGLFFYGAVFLIEQTILKKFLINNKIGL